MVTSKVGEYNPVSSKSVKSNTVNPQNIKTSETVPAVEDSVEISAEGKEKAEKVNNISFDIQRFREQLKSSKEETKAGAEANKVRLTCQKIARRIMKGDIVPQKDQKYLLKNAPGMYMQAVSLKVHNDDPKKHKRLSKDDKPEYKTGAQTSQSDQATETVSETPVTAETEADTPSPE